MSSICPSSLYKYFAPERLNFFKSLCVRYSQLGDFNDPFEGRPEFKSLTDSVNINSAMNELLQEEVARTYQQLPGHIRAVINFDKFTAAASRFATLKQPEIFEGLDEIGVKATSFVTEKIDQLLGVLCLSEVPDSLLMWAHYASSHTGFVVEFDAHHPSFHEKKSEQDDLRHIRQVYYRDSRPSASLYDMGAIELFLVKSSHWSYEREWRIVRPLSDAVETIHKSPYPIALFKMPPAAIKGVIIGARTASKHVAAIRQAIDFNPELSAIRIRRAVLDKSNFELRFVEEM